jgi:hypothetical protein
MTRNITRKSNERYNVWMEQFPKEKDGVIYVRQSSKAQVEQNIHSFEMQTEKFIEYFRNMGCTGNITIIPDDEGVSGTVDIHKRVGMSKIMKLIEEEAVGWTAAVHVNRFTSTASRKYPRSLGTRRPFVGEVEKDPGKDGCNRQ